MLHIFNHNFAFLIIYKNPINYSIYGVSSINILNKGEEGMNEIYLVSGKKVSITVNTDNSTNLEKRWTWC